MNGGMREIDESEGHLLSLGCARRFKCPYAHTLTALGGVAGELWFYFKH